MKNKIIASLLALCIGCGAATAIQASADLQDGTLSLGDPDRSGTIDASDACVILKAAAMHAATGTTGLTVDETMACDVDRNGSVSAEDATYVLIYAAESGAGYQYDFETFLGIRQKPSGTAQTPTEPTPAPTMETLPPTQPTESYTLPTVPASDEAVDAVFLGVQNYGAASTTFSNAGSFVYRFLVDGSERLYTVDNTTVGDMPYPIQNMLKVNYHFRIWANGNEIYRVQEIENNFPLYTPPISGVPGELTLRNLLTTAMEPVGTTLYMFGGGWNWQDNGSGWQTRSIGVQPDWVRFWQEHDGSYTYRTSNHATTYYPYGEFNQYYYAGLDCSGFVSWAVYNTLHDENGLPGYGGKSTQMARRFQSYGWGTWTHSVTTSTVMKPGDIMSMNGHVWLSLGTCSDGSIVIAHSTPSNSRSGQPGGGVQIGAVGNSTSCQAYQLASKYMTRFYSEWCSRYTVTLKSKSDYLAVKAADAGKFSWNCYSPLTDPDGIQNMSADQALALIFGV